MNNICDLLIPQVTLAVQATGVLTSADTGAFTNGKVVVVGGVTYEFVTALSEDPTVENEVLIGADGDECLANLVKAINASGTEGTEYSVGTVVNPKVTAGAVTDHAVTVTAIEHGFVGNIIASTTDEAKLSWGAATLVGGVGGVLTGVVLGGATGTIYTEKQDVGGYEELINFLSVTAQSGTNPTLDVTQQLSPDGLVWTDGDAFTQVTTATTQTLKRTTANFGKYMRYKIVLGGTAPRYTLSMKAIGKA